MNIIFDTDVVISASLSSRGAAYYLLHQNFALFTSTKQLREIQRVATELSEKFTIDFKVIRLFEKTAKKISLKNEALFLKFVNDLNDAFILAEAAAAHAQFLITYNITDYHSIDIFQHFGIKILTPAFFVQLLRKGVV